jgi:hypothetical protein
MATTIKIKRSETANNVPSASDLAVGELAMNPTDQKMWTKLSNGTVVEIATVVDISGKEDAGTSTAMAIALG